MLMFRMAYVCKIVFPSQSCPQLQFELLIPYIPRQQLFDHTSMYEQLLFFILCKEPLDVFAVYIEIVCIVACLWYTNTQGGVHSALCYIQTAPTAPQKVTNRLQFQPNENNIITQRTLLHYQTGPGEDNQQSPDSPQLIMRRRCTCSFHNTTPTLIITILYINTAHDSQLSSYFLTFLVYILNLPHLYSVLIT